MGKGDASTVYAYYNTSPESPDGKRIFYLLYKNEPDDQQKSVPGELWICSRSLKN